MDDPYSILKLPTTATREEVIKAYNTLARRHSPTEHPDDQLAEPMFALVTEAFHLIMLERYEEAKRSPPQASSASLKARPPDPPTLQFNGLYQADRGSDSCSYLRFYPDQTVLAVSSTGTAAEVARWLDKEAEWASRGGYEINGQNLDFMTHSTLGTVEYSGVIRGLTRLDLSWYSHINQQSGRATYHFAQTPFAQTPLHLLHQRQEPPSLSESSQPGPDIEQLGRKAWRMLTWELAIMAGLAIISFIVVGNHIRQSTGIGFALTLTIIVGLIVLYMNTGDCIEAWREYVLARRRKRSP